MAKTHNEASKIVMALVSVACLVGSGCAPTTSHPQPPSMDQRPTAHDLGCERSSAPPPRGIFGINLGNQESNRLADVSALGIEWVRADVPWESVEAEQGAFTWKGLDAAIIDAEREKIRLELVINHPPGWAWSQPDRGFTRAAGEFANRLVNRYKPSGELARQQGWTSFGVTVWSVFNEPNLPGYGWGEKGDDARALLPRYVATLGAVNRGVREADGAASIVLGGLSSRDDVAVEEVLQTIAARGASECFDVIAFHPYGYEGRLLEAKERIRAVASELRLGDLPVWFDEFGTNDESRQSELAREAARVSADVDGIFWFALSDFHEFDGRYGVMRDDGSRKPVFEELKRAVAALD